MLGDAKARDLGLKEHAEGTEHGKAAVLELLHLLCPVFLGAVVEVERVEAGLSESEVTGLLVATDDALGAEALEEEDEGKNVPVAGLGDLREGSVRVKGSVGISRNAHIGVTGEVEPGGDDVSDHSELGDSAVDDLGLAVPLETVSSEEVGWVVGEASGIESDITGEGTIKVSGSLVEGEGDRAVIVEHREAEY